MNVIPLTAGRSTSFDVDIKGKRYKFEFTFNGRVGTWTIKLSTQGVVLVESATFVIGVELFLGHAKPDIPRGLIAVPIDDKIQDAAYSELGGRVKLVELVTEDEIDDFTVSP